MAFLGLSPESQASLGEGWAEDRQSSHGGLWFLLRQLGRACRSGPGARAAAEVTHQSWHRDSTVAGRPRMGRAQSHQPVPCRVGCGGRCTPPKLLPFNSCSLTAWSPCPHLVPATSPPSTCLNAASYCVLSQREDESWEQGLGRKLALSGDRKGHQGTRKNKRERVASCHHSTPLPTSEVSWALGGDGHPWEDAIHLQVPGVAEPMAPRWVPRPPVQITALKSVLEVRILSPAQTGSGNSQEVLASGQDVVGLCLPDPGFPVHHSFSPCFYSSLLFSASRNCSGAVTLSGHI